MKASFVAAIAVLSAALGTLSTAAAQQAYTQTTSVSVNKPIFDNDASGVSSTLNFSSTDITVLQNMKVTLEVTGDHNGDLYGYVSHGSGISILLNRPGKSAANASGYSDDGLNVTFDDAGPDFHTYRMTLSGNEGTPVLGTVTGVFAPDARNIDPGLVLTSDARTAFLSAFENRDPNGAWTLFIADLSPGGTSSLIGWGVEITGVPEPTTVSLLLMGTGLIWLIRRRK